MYFRCYLHDHKTPLDEFLILNYFDINFDLLVQVSNSQVIERAK